MKFIVFVIKQQQKIPWDQRKDQARKSLKYDVHLHQSKRRKCKQEGGGKNCSRYLNYNPNIVAMGFQFSLQVFFYLSHIQFIIIHHQKLGLFFFLLNHCSFIFFQFILNLKEVPFVHFYFLFLLITLQPTGLPAFWDLLFYLIN